MKKKEKLGNLKKKSNFGKIKFGKKNKKKRREKFEKKGLRITVDYCCNPQ